VRRVLLLVGWSLLLAASQTQLEAQEPPSPPKLEFTGPDAGWPPRVKGATNVRIVGWQEAPGSLTDQVEARVRRAAERDARVRRELGERFAYISADEIEEGKGRRRDPARPLAVRVTFFSHSNNSAVEVTIRGGVVEGVARRPDDQPPEGVGEIAAAVALARRDSRLRGKVQGLTGHAILVSPDQGEPGYGHRVLTVTFRKRAADVTVRRDAEELPRYFALVDLSDQKVLAAGPFLIRGR